MLSKATSISENDLKRLIARVIRDQIAVYENPVYDEEVPLLVEVAKTRDIPRRKRNEIFRLAELFDKLLAAAGQTEPALAVLSDTAASCDKLGRTEQAAQVRGTQKKEYRIAGV